MNTPIKKFILFTQRVEVVASYNERRDCADIRIAQFISACGFIPLALPNNTDIARSIAEQIQPCVIIFTGGNSLVKYGGTAPERDEMEKKLLDFALERKIPVYGFCRGMQVILDYFGQPLSSVQNHIAVRHRLQSDFWNNRIVNSYHAQGLFSKDFCTNELEILAQTDDGVVEAVRGTSFPLFATMWHPEREEPFSQDDINIIRALCNKNI